jgi:hypothetical protein
VWVSSILQPWWRKFLHIAKAAMLCHEMLVTGKAGAFSKFTRELSYFGLS